MWHQIVTWTLKLYRRAAKYRYLIWMRRHRHMHNALLETQTQPGDAQNYFF